MSEPEYLNSALDVLGIQHYSMEKGDASLTKLEGNTVAVYPEIIYGSTTNVPAAILFRKFLEEDAVDFLYSAAPDEYLHAELRRQALRAILARSRGLEAGVQTEWFRPKLLLPKAELTVFPSVDRIAAESTPSTCANGSTEPTLHICLSPRDVFDYQAFRTTSSKSYKPHKIYLWPGDAVLFRPDIVQEGSAGDERSVFLSLSSDLAPSDHSQAPPSSSPTDFDADAEARAIVAEADAQLAAEYKEIEAKQRAEKKATKAELAEREREYKAYLEKMEELKRVRQRLADRAATKQKVLVEKRAKKQAALDAKQKTLEKEKKALQESTERNRALKEDIEALEREIAAATPPVVVPTPRPTATKGKKGHSAAINVPTDIPGIVDLDEDDDIIICSNSASGSSARSTSSAAKRKAPADTSSGKRHSTRIAAST